MSEIQYLGPLEEGEGGGQYLGPLDEEGPKRTAMQMVSDYLNPMSYVKEATIPERVAGGLGGLATFGPVGAVVGAAMPREAGRAARKVARYGAPIAGGLGGALVGGLPGEIVGSALGELAGQAIGGEEINLQQAAVAGALPGVARGAAKAIGAVGRPLMRGAAKAMSGTMEWMQEVANTHLWNTVKEMEMRAGNLNEAWDTARAMGKGVTVPTAPLKAALAKARVEEGVLSKYQFGEHTIAKQLDDMSTGLAEHEFVPFNEYDLLRRRLGEYVQKYTPKEGPIYGITKSLHRAAMDGISGAIDAAGEGATPAIQALRTARELTKQTKSFEALREILNKKSVIDMTAEGVPFIKPKGLMNELHRNENIRSLGPENMNRLRVMTEEWGRGKWKLSSPESSLTGPGALVIAGSLASVPGAVAGYKQGGVPGAVVAGVPLAIIGAVGGRRVLSAGVDQISRMMLSETGKALLTQLFKQSKGRLDHKFLTALFQVPRVALDQAMSETPLPKSQSRNQQPDMERVFGPYFAERVKSR